MQITSSTPDRVEVALSFTRSWKATNRVVLTLAPAEAGPEVTWTMHGENRGVAALFARFMNMDALLGKDFEKGLAQLKAVAEA